MTTNSLISQSERKLLLCLILTINCVFYAHCVINTVEEYNEKVRIEHSEKLFLVNTSPHERPQFSACFFAPPVYTQLFWIQFFTNPLLFFFLRKPKPLALFFTSIITIVITLSLLSWIRRNYVDYLLDDMYWLHKTYYGYFSMTSHISEIVLAVLSCAFLFVQLWILFRYAVEKFQLKISLN